MYLFLLAQILTLCQYFYFTGYVFDIYFKDLFSLFVCVCAHIVFSGDGAADGWEPVDVSAGNQTVLGKSNKFS